MDNICTTLNNTLLGVAAVLFIKDSLVLFIRGKNNRARQTMGLTTLIWGVMYLVYLIANLYGVVDYPILSGESLISSHIFICVMFLFPLEVLFPGWFSIKRLLWFLTPITILSTVYFLGLQFTGQHIEKFYTFSECVAALGRFNVWYRLVFLVCNFLYLFHLLYILKRREVKYIKWQNENFSDLDSVDISWLHYYRHMMIVIVTCYLFVAIWGGVWSIIVHTLTVIVCFSILSYKGLFYENALAQDLSDPEDEEEREEVLVGEVAVDIDDEKNLNSETAFELRLPLYVEKLTRWLETEKPYLHSDFKLLDVIRVLPLNRSYLSRVFNEGFHQNFSEVVRYYRIEHAKKVLVEHPNLTLYKVAELCGFTSDSTFIRAFQKVTGMTPKQYKSTL